MILNSKLSKISKRNNKKKQKMKNLKIKKRDYLRVPSRRKFKKMSIKDNLNLQIYNKITQ